MTYFRDGYEHLDAQEQRVYDAVKRLNAAGRTTNNSQIANATGIGRTTIANITGHLGARGFLRNVSMCAAYHWRVTNQPVPYSRADRERDREQARRQAVLNDPHQRG